jgi:ArsR family transcriptional regulator, arsenate/arsenite/antimonite-responsive transcriptional repressor
MFVEVSVGCHVAPLFDVCQIRGVSKLLAKNGQCCAPLTDEPLSARDAADLAPLFKALGDPVRLRLVSMIACHEGGEACVCELTDAFDLTAPTISHHLKVLRESGMVDTERRGTWIYYRVNPEVLARVSGVLLPGRAAAMA